MRYFGKAGFTTLLRRLQAALKTSTDKVYRKFEQPAPIEQKSYVKGNRLIHSPAKGQKHENTHCFVHSLKGKKKEKSIEAGEALDIFLAQPAPFSRGEIFRQFQPANGGSMQAFRPVTRRGHHASYLVITPLVDDQ